MLDVIDAVQRAAGHAISVKYAARRPGDPAIVVAHADRLRTLLGWQPQFDDLDQIVTDALAWERKLQTRPRLAPRQAAVA